MKDLDLASVLRYTPYDNKVSSIFDSEYEEVVFFEELFVEYYEKKLQKVENELMSMIKKPQTRFIHFIGAAGTGKTTFLHYFKRSLKQEDEISFGFVDLVENPSILSDRETVKHNVCKCIDAIAKDDVFNFILDSDDIWTKKVCNSFAFQNYLFKKTLDSDYSASEGLLPYYDESQLLSIYAILFVYTSNYNDGRLEKRQQNVICVDNVDELTLVYIANSIDRLIQDAFSTVQYFFENIENRIFDRTFSFINHFTFIVSIREVSVKRISKKEGQMQPERSNSMFGSINYDQDMFPFPEMVEKRLDFYIKHNNKDNDGGINDSTVSKAVCSYKDIITSESKYISTHILPLMNFDRRMLSLSFEKIFESNNPVFLESKVGKRGAILLSTLDFLYNQTKRSSLFSGYVCQDMVCKQYNRKQRCNIYRMCFTLLTNLGGIDNIPDEKRNNVLNNEAEFFEHLLPVSLNLFFDRLKSCKYSDDDIKNALIMLISISNSNYEIPAFFEGRVVDQVNDDYYNNIDNRFLTSSYSQELVERIMPMTEVEKGNIAIKINPLCVIYPYHVFIHFEYFNIVSYYDPVNNDNKYDLKPLFLISDLEELKSCLKRVRSSFQDMVKKAEKHFIEANFNLEQYKNDQFCFNGALYSTRCISSIIRYLDSYRIYKWNNELNKDYHNILSDEIKRYINIFQDKNIQDDVAKGKIAEIKRELNRIEDDGGYGRSIMPETDDFGVQ